MAAKRIRIIGGQEIALRLGVSKQRAYRIIAKKGFPPPVAQLRQGRLWLTDEVDAWIRANRHPLTTD